MQPGSKEQKENAKSTDIENIMARLTTLLKLMANFKQNKTKTKNEADMQKDIF